MFKCKRCGHEWEAIVDSPKACPSCKSYKWSKEFDYKKMKVEKKDG